MRNVTQGMIERAERTLEAYRVVPVDRPEDMLTDAIMDLTVWAKREGIDPKETLEHCLWLLPEGDR